MNTYPEFEDICSSSKQQEANHTAEHVVDEPTVLFDSVTDSINTFDEIGNDIKSNQTSSSYDDDLFLFGDDEKPMSFARSNKSKPLNAYSAKHKKQIKQNIKIFNILTSALLIICIIITGMLGAVAHITGDMTKGYISDDPNHLGIDQTLAEKLPSGIINIALFGVDSRSRVTNDRSKAIKGLSDSIIVLSINTNDNTIKMTSLLRDSWVPIEGHKNNKLNAAYSKGGAQLAIKTINQNYGLNITDYVSVSLYQLWKVIDFMGGVDIKITEAERVELNRLATKEGFNVDRLDKKGLVHLNGGQAMIYARIRKIDSENNRALRQQKVLNCLFEKAKKLSVTQYDDLLKAILAHVETSLSYSEIIKFAPLLSSSITLQSTSVPGDEVVAYGGIFEDTNGGWVWKYDLDEAKKYIHKWIYNIEY